MTEHSQSGAEQQGQQAPEQEPIELTNSRRRFRRLLATNPNYFGNLPGFGFDPIEPKTGDTTYEQIDCVSYSPARDRIEATIEVKLPFGYSGGLCGNGSFEHLRFYVDDGSGWQDAGPAGINVHDIAVGQDCSGDRTLPLSYVAGVRYAPRRNWCFRPVLPKVRAILSWELPPPPNQPDWTPVWGDVQECNVQVAPRRFVFHDVIADISKELLAQLPAHVVNEPPHPEPDPGPFEAVPLPQLARIYRKAQIPPHRFAFPALTSVSETISADAPTLAASALVAKEAGIDLAGVLKVLEDGAGNTDYEELECLGLDEGLEALVATFHVKRPSGYSGPPCSAGSTEYIAFWADWDDDCRYTYLGTVPVTVHDYRLPDGGLCYAAILPVDLGQYRRSCEKPLLPRVRAVLSWATPPSTVDPEAVPFWGHRLDRHVQVAPGRPYDGTANFRKVGGIFADNVDLVTGLTLPGAKLGSSTIPLDPPNRPFAGLIELQGPLDPALAGHQYRIRATNVDSGGTVLLTTPFNVVTFAGDATVTPDPVDGWVPWPTYLTNTDGLLGVHSPGGDDRWDYTLELDTPGAVVDTARLQMDNTVRNSIVPTDTINAGDLTLNTLGACRQPRGPLTGSFVARDRHFQQWSIGVLGGPGGPIPPTPLTVGISTTTQTPFSGTPFTLDLSNLEPCAYVVQLTILDLAIVNSNNLGHHTTIERGVCLE
jgi:hypothetical protein